MIPIFSNKKLWDTLTTDELQEYSDLVFNHYRSVGYPYYKVDIEKELATLKKSGSAKFEDKIVRQKMAGLALAWSYFPHAVDVRNGTSLSPLEIFNDDTLFKKCIEKRIKYGDNISDAAIRKSLRKYGGVGVSNFRPTSASFIYDYLSAKTTWDMSGGYGGRLLGAWLSKSIEHYIATEPCTETYNGLIKLSNDLSNHADKKFLSEIYKVGSEDFIPDMKIDLCFTSPPYFNQERYSNEPSQSYIKYPTYDKWINGYLYLTISNCYQCLANDGRLVVNIANTKTAPNLENDFLDIAKSLEFELEDTLYLELSGREHYTKDKSFKYEPIFILKKNNVNSNL